MCNDLRKRILAERKSLDSDTRKKYNDAILGNITNLNNFITAGNIFTYLNTPFEAETLSLAEYSLKSGKMVFAPITDREMNMYFAEITSLNDLKKGFMGILEPIGGAEKKPKKGDLFIVPGSAFDLKGHRMGYGKGCYDRYFLQYPDVIKVGVCYDFQLLENIPHEEHDIDMDILVTNKRTVIVKGDELNDQA